MRNAAAGGRHRPPAAAEAGRRHGFVAMAVDMYLRLRDLLGEDLAERTLLLIGGFATRTRRPGRARRRVGARPPRPHVLLTFRRTAGVKTARVARAKHEVAYGAVRCPR